MITYIEKTERDANPKLISEITNLLPNYDLGSRKGGMLFSYDTNVDVFNIEDKNIDAKIILNDEKIKDFCMSNCWGEYGIWDKCTCEYTTKTHYFIGRDEKSAMKILDIPKEIAFVGEAINILSEKNKLEYLVKTTIVHVDHSTDHCDDTIEEYASLFRCID